MSDLDRKNHLLSRRDLLVGTAKAVAAAVLLDTVTSPPPVAAQETSAPKPTEIKPSTETELLKAAGLEDFTNLYRVTSETQRIFRATPFGDLYSILAQAVVIPQYADMQERSRLRDGWNEKKDQAQKDALAKVDQFKIDTSQTQDNQTDVRNFLKRFAQNFPAMIMASPDQIKMLATTEGYYTHQNEIAFGNFNDRERVTWIAFHEFTHAIDINWEATKPYIDRKQFAEHTAKKATVVKDVFEKWLALPWEQASTYKFLEPLLAPDYPDNEDFKKLVEKTEAEFGTKIDIPLPSDKSNDYVYRYNRLAHFVGRVMIKTAEKNKQKQPLDPNEKFIRENSQTDDLMNMVFNNIDHIFVNPVLSKNWQLTSHITDLFFASSQLHTATEQIQETRLKTYSLLPSNASFSDLRRALGLQPGTGSRYVAGENNRAREEMRSKELFGLLTRFGFRPIMEFPMKESQPDVPGYRFYEAPTNPFAPDKKTVLVEFLQEPKFSPLLVEIPKDKFSSDFPQWQSRYTNPKQLGQTAKLMIDIPNNPSVTVEITGDYAQTTDPTYVATVLLNKPTTEYIDEETLYAPFVIKRGTIDFKNPGTPSAGNVAYKRDGVDPIDIFPLPENINHKAYSLHLVNNFHNVLVVEDKTTGRFSYIPNGRLLTERNSGHFTANLERPGVVREGRNRFSFNLIEPWHFSVPENFLPQFADLTGQEQGNLRFNYRLIPTKHISEDPNMKPQVRYILEAQDRSNPNLKTRFPVYVTADNNNDLSAY